MHYSCMHRLALTAGICFFFLGNVTAQQPTNENDAIKTLISQLAAVPASGSVVPVGESIVFLNTRASSAFLPRLIRLRGTVYQRFTTPSSLNSSKTELPSRAAVFGVPTTISIAVFRSIPYGQTLSSFIARPQPFSIQRFVEESSAAATTTTQSSPTAVTVIDLQRSFELTTPVSSSNVTITRNNTISRQNSSSLSTTTGTPLLSFTTTQNSTSTTSNFDVQRLLNTSVVTFGNMSSTTTMFPRSVAEENSTLTSSTTLPPILPRNQSLFTTTSTTTSTEALRSTSSTTMSSFDFTETAIDLENLSPEQIGVEFSALNSSPTTAADLLQRFATVAALGELNFSSLARSPATESTLIPVANDDGQEKGFVAKMPKIFATRRATRQAPPVPTTTIDLLAKERRASCNSFEDFDCLHLTVFCPVVQSPLRPNNNTLKPVLVVFDDMLEEIALENDAFSPPAPSAIAEQTLLTLLTSNSNPSVIIVSVSARTNPLFQVLTALDASGASVAGFNHGLQDLKVALDWLTLNIGTFGGDAKKITLLTAGDFEHFGRTLVAYQQLPEIRNVFPPAMRLVLHRHSAGTCAVQKQFFQLTEWARLVRSSGALAEFIMPNELLIQAVNPIDVARAILAENSTQTKPGTFRLVDALQAPLLVFGPNITYGLADEPEIFLLKSKNFSSFFRVLFGYDNLAADDTLCRPVATNPISNISDFRLALADLLGSTVAHTATLNCVENSVQAFEWIASLLLDQLYWDRVYSSVAELAQVLLAYQQFLSAALPLLQFLDIWRPSGYSGNSVVNSANFLRNTTNFYTYAPQLTAVVASGQEETSATLLWKLWILFAQADSGQAQGGGRLANGLIQMMNEEDFLRIKCVGFGGGGGVKQELQAPSFCASSEPAVLRSYGFTDWVKNHCPERAGLGHYSK